MFAPLKRVAVLSMATAGVWIVGCDDISSADKSVQEKLEKAAAENDKVDVLQVGEDPTVADAAFNAFKSAASDKSADPVFRATAAGAAGDYAAQLALAQRAELGNIEQKIRGTLSDLRVLAQQVTYINYLAGGYEKYDPKAAVVAIELQIKKMQGDASSPTWTPEGGQGAIPTIAGVKQEISRLEGEIAQRKEQIDTLGKEREAALTTAEAKFAEAAKLKGDASVKIFAEGAEARKSAEDRSVKADVTTDQLNRLEADLAVAKGQEAATNAGIELLQKQVEAINGGWTETQARVAGQKKIAGSILTGEDNVAISINGKAGDLAKLLVLAKEKRAAIANALDDAAKYYGDAATAAGEVGKNKNVSVQGPGAKAYKDLKEALHSGRYNLPLANVLRVQGAIAADEASLLGEVSTASALLKTALSDAGLTVPSDLPSVDTQEISNLINAANEKLSESKNKLDSVIGGDTPVAVKNAGLVSQLITLHRLITLDGQRVQVGMPAFPDSPGAAGLLTDARDMKSQILAAGERLPALPGELGQTPPASAVPAPAPGGAGETPVEAPAPAGGFGAPAN